ncbi:MAG TPA: 30S ribosome-binding factor RbfA [Gemmatimonadaceae bacterium]|nr:30S ribosome-binding factor RbfA [Gemmatimonadaceae bacterium]
MASSNPRRPDRVAEAIREEVATFLAEGVKDPRVVGLITVTGVDVTRDLRHAKVFVSVLGSDEEKSATFEGLASVATHLRAKVGRALRLRLAPEISFAPDESVARAARIESLLSQIKQETPAAADAGDAGAAGQGSSGPATGDAAERTD